MWRYISTDELYHTGVLGMKWHHHKAKVAAKKLKKADSEWEKSALKSDTHVAVYNHAADKINSKIDTFNAKWPKVNFNDPKLKKYNDEYMQAYGKLWNKTLQKSADDIIKANPSGTKKIKVTAVNDGSFPKIEIVDVKNK